MPVHQLQTTSNFIIVWTGGADSSGLFIFENRDELWRGPQCYIDLELIPALIQMLRAAQAPLTLFNRINKDHQIIHLNRPKVPFVPASHRLPKKHGGVWGEAYYAPLVVNESKLLQKLAEALETGCSRENVVHLEENNFSESEVVLNGNYLTDGRWFSISGGYTIKALPLSESFEQQPASDRPKPVVSDKPRLFPFPFYPGTIGKFLLRQARREHQCYRSIYRQCLVKRWIQPGEYYVEYRHGQTTDRYHLQCAFRSQVIPLNWLNPHFEQYHLLVQLGYEKWIKVEQEKRSNYQSESYHIPLEVEDVQKLLQALEAGHQLGEEEREAWREHLRNVPIDLDPYQSARKWIGLTDPRQ